MSKPVDYGSEVFRSLMDLDLLLQDGDQMSFVRMFLGGINPESPALEKLHKEILAFTARIQTIADASKPR